MEKERELRTEFSREEMAQKVELYNAVTKDHLKMTLVSGGWRSSVFALEGFFSSVQHSFIHTAASAACFHSDYTTFDAAT